MVRAAKCGLVGVGDVEVGDGLSFDFYGQVSEMMRDGDFEGVFDEVTGTFSRDEQEARLVRRIARLVHAHDQQMEVIERLRAENSLLQRTAEANELHIASLEIQIRRLVHPPISLTDVEPATPTRLPPTPDAPRKLTRAETLVGETLREYLQGWPAGSKRAREAVDGVLESNNRHFTMKSRYY